MLKRNNNETILNEYIDYLKDKGKIIKIKDTSKETNIKFSSSIIYYFLLIVSIVLIILTIYLFGSTIIKPSTDGENYTVIVVGVALFTAIVIGVTINEKENIKLNISYPNEKQIKVNNKIFDIENEDIYIDIIKNYEYQSRHDIEGRRRPGYHTVKYLLKIKGKGSSKSFQITYGTEEQLKDFIYNFEYEISDLKREKSEFIKNTQNALEELYDKGSGSREIVNKLKSQLNSNEKL